MKMNYTEMLARVTKYRADPESIMKDAEDIRRRTLDEGLVSEKVHMRLEDGTVGVLERDPATALGAVRLKLEVLKWLQARADEEQTDNTECVLIVPGLNLNYMGDMKVYGAEVNTP